MTVYLHEGDLPDHLLAPGPVAVDSATMVLSPPPHLLCTLTTSGCHDDSSYLPFPSGRDDSHTPTVRSADPERLNDLRWAGLNV